MGNLFLTLLLIVGIVILAIPQSISKTVKKALPVLLVLAVIFSTALFINIKLKNDVSIIATGEKNEKAEGKEIFLKEVIINGKSKKPKEIFSKGWIEKDDGLLWRDYDKPDDLKDSIQADFNCTDKIVFVLKQNKWQGKAEVVSEQYKQDKQDKQEFDGYVDSESDSWMNLEVDVSDESGLLKKYPFLNILIGIVGGN
ncbi:hypothetical protein EHV10_07260 [Lachnoanaerobaculum gingivalis]|uniref:Uncharacterized protein n=1 Tax=Lachnoanaerobaculum gingivalis TaxID=2490855 RepID=A0A3P3QXI1_9FIRM|nr:hypothetical protein [Lachnoanaerobaculum gingivalis]RRJ25438.1 hypothetical protein EHV10_07260 [Lachnoanaerobaculum gingivalis]WHE87732.1 hypothetical protein QJR73_01625 [Lachnoanaerobaculum gingivalis]